MVVERLSPSMEYREEPDVRAQMVRIAGHGQEGFGHSLKEEVVHHPWILQREGTEGMGEGKHHMDVRDVEQLCFAGGEPGGLGVAWTLRTMPIATGVIGLLFVPTMIALGNMAAEGGGAAHGDSAQGSVLRARQGVPIVLDKGGAMLAHDIGHFQDRPTNGSLSRSAGKAKASRGLSVAVRAGCATWR